MLFACLSNVMLRSQAKACGLALSSPFGIVQPYTVSKKLILLSVSVECNTD